MKRIRICKACSYFFSSEEKKCPECDGWMPNSYLEEKTIFDKIDEFKKLHPEAGKALALLGAILKR